MLTAADPAAPPAARRVLVAGVSGSGKTTLAARIGCGCSALPYTEIDAPLPRRRVDASAPSSRRTSTRSVRSDAWVTEWQYSTRPAAARRARGHDGVAGPAVPGHAGARRTPDAASPGASRGAVERQPRGARCAHFFTDPEHVVRWSISTRNLYRRAPARRSPQRTRTCRSYACDAGATWTAGSATCVVPLA